MRHRSAFGLPDHRLLHRQLCSALLLGMLLGVPASNSQAEGTGDANNAAQTTAFMQGENGVLAIEAEHFDGTSGGNAHRWSSRSHISASGMDAIEARPDHGDRYDSEAIDSSPRLDYRVHFRHSGKHHVWLRMFAANENNNSAHIGLDGRLGRQSDDITLEKVGSGSWEWTRATMEGAAATLDVATPGTHTLNLWMREDGAQIDKIIITRSDDSKPSGKGPMESPRERVASVAPSLDANPDAGSSDLDGNGTELPTQAGRHTLFRYPYLQKERADSLAILWATSIKGSGSVTVRDANGEKVTTAASTTTRFRSTNTGLGTDFFQHQVTLTGLSPDTEFLYDVLHDGQLLARNVPFKTLPLPGSERIDFVTFGDSGTEYGAPRLIRDRIASRKPDGSHVYPHDMILGVGDLAYTDGSFIEFDHKFFDQLSGKGIRPSEHAPENGILASRVFFASLGNHEFGNKWAEVPEAYLASFAFPAAAGAPAEDHERYYSFDAGPAHFVMIDTMKFAGKQLRKQEMLDWLERDLAATKQPWKLAFFHHSFFSLGAHGTWGDQWENSTMRKQMVPILQKHGVQLAFFGHDHMYQRTQPIKVDNSGGATQGKILRHEDGRLVSEGGIVYVGAGNGGADLGNRDTQPSQYNSDLWKKQRGEWGIGYDFLAERNGHPILYDDISNDSDEPLQPQKRKGFVHVSVTREKVSVTAINTEGETLDAFEITR